VISTAVTSDEVRAAAETHRELPPEYQSAVIDSFLSKVDREIDARVDARLAAQGHRRDLARPRSPAFFVLATLVLSIPLTAIAAYSGGHGDGIWGVLVIWVALIAIDVTYIGRSRPPSPLR